MKKDKFIKKFYYCYNLIDGAGKYLMDNIDIEICKDTGYIPLKVRRWLKTMRGK